MAIPINTTITALEISNLIANQNKPGLFGDVNELFSPNENISMSQGNL